jgi:hypothetical protein
LLPIIACKTESLEPSALINWVHNRDNGLIKEEVIGEAKYTVMYIPPQYLLAKSLINNDSFAIKLNSESNHCFVIKMEPLDGNSQFLTLGAMERSEPYERINYYMNDIAQDISILVGNDTVNIDNLVLERYYNVSPAQNLVVAFRTDRTDLKGKDIRLTLNDRAIHTGLMNFEFSSSLIKGIPNLNTKSKDL